MKTSNQQAAERLHIARARTIEKYSELEQALCTLFAHLLQTDPSYAAVVFFKITSSRSRLSIVEKLLKKRLGVDYASAFWNPVIAALKMIDQKRNEVVHWTTCMKIGDSEPLSMLVPPNIYEWTAARTTASWDGNSLDAYRAECDFYLRLINMFSFTQLDAAMKDHIPDAVQKTWRDIFQQAPTYPPLDTHPLSPNYIKP